MSPSEALHLKACAYANQRKSSYEEGMAEKRLLPVSEEYLHTRWLAHYEGFVEGYSRREDEVQEVKG
jgi:hypothetical protein